MLSSGGIKNWLIETMENIKRSIEYINAIKYPIGEDVLSEAIHKSMAFSKRTINIQQALKVYRLLE